MPTEKNTFYLTTPIYYVNARPHIGHAYTTLTADTIARHKRLQGFDTFFLTGTDEHGQKIQRSAAAAGIPPQHFADQVSAQFEGLWKRMGITNNDYIRTTDDRHKRGVQKLFTVLYEKGFIELQSYTGQYCVSEEMFVEGPPGTIGPDGRPTETVTEENFFFRLSEFQLQLLDRIESDELKITPEARKNEVLSFLRGNVAETESATPNNSVMPNSPVIPSEARNLLSSEALTSPVVLKSKLGFRYVKGALKDLSVSRTSFDWGIPVPEIAQKITEKKHVIYVWLDALANYLTALGYGSDDTTLFEKYWPADLHLVGKEITRFHCVYWPAFLLAAGLPLPKKIVAHGWLLFEESKMSKSRGNIVRTETILEGFGSLKPDLTKAKQDLFATDVLRYFLLREIPFGQDGSFSFDAMVTRYNADLANGYGNLVSRTLSMIEKYRQSVITDFASLDGLTAIQNNLFAGLDSQREQVERQEFARAIQTIHQIVASIDFMVSSRSPWQLAKSDEGANAKALSDILYVAAESIRVITALLYPFLPYATAQVWQQLGLGDIEAAAANGELNNLEWGGLKSGTKLGTLGPIFPRIDKKDEKEFIARMADLEQSNRRTPPSTPQDSSSRPGPSQSEGEVERSASPSPEAKPAEGAQTIAPPADVPTEPSHITIDDFLKVELRVGQIKLAERIPKADKLLRLEVDLGTETRQILSGIAEWYTPEDLVGRRIAVVTNLAPRKMRGLESHGMLLAASDGEHGKPILASFSDDIALGSRIR